MLDITDKRIVRSKMLLKQTFLSLLEKKKIKYITITEIVEKANYNRGTFYAHFESKEDLLYIYRAHGIAGMIIRWIEEDFSASPEYMSKQEVELMLTSTDKFVVK